VVRWRWILAHGGGRRRCTRRRLGHRAGSLPLTISEQIGDPELRRDGERL
jgi:hypothetical protein